MFKLEFDLEFEFLICMFFKLFMVGGSFFDDVVYVLKYFFIVFNVNKIVNGIVYGVKSMFDKVNEGLVGDFVRRWYVKE